MKFELLYRTTVFGACKKMSDTEGGKKEAATTELTEAFDESPAAISYENEQSEDRMDSKPAAIPYGREYVGEATEEMDSKPAAIEYNNELAEEDEIMDSKPAAIIHDESEYAGEEEEIDAKLAAVECNSILEQPTKDVYIKQNQQGVMGVPSVRTELEPEGEIPEENDAYVGGAECEILEQRVSHYLPPVMADISDEAAQGDRVLEQQTKDVHMEQNRHGVIGLPSAQTDVALEQENFEDENIAAVEGTEDAAPIIIYDQATNAGMMAPIEEGDYEENSRPLAMPTLKDPPPTAPTEVAPSAAADEEAGQGSATAAERRQQPGAVSSTEVPVGANDKQALKAGQGTNGGKGTASPADEEKEGEPKKPKREINADYKDLQATGKWGKISKMEMIVVGVVSLFIVGGVIVGVVLFLGNESDAVKGIVPPLTNAPTPMATPIPAVDRFPFLIGALSSNNATKSLVETTYSSNPAIYEDLMGPEGRCSSLPHVCAMSWVLYEDAYPPPSDDIAHRFALANLYFSLGGSDWKNNDKWLSSESYCDWHGVNCNRLRTVVEEIDMNDNNLVGEIPTEFALADTLTIVSLKSNAITGGLSGAVFGAMPELFVLYVQNNLFTGPIPDNLRDSKSLLTLFLHGNDFFGPYPSVYCENIPERWQFSLDCEENACPEGCCAPPNNYYCY